MAMNGISWIGKVWIGLIRFEIERRSSKQVSALTCDLHASVPAHQAGQEDEVEELDLDLAASRDENVEPDLPNEEGVAEVGAADDGPRVEVDNGKEDPDENAEEGQDQELAVDVDRSP